MVDVLVIQRWNNHIAASSQSTIQLNVRPTGGAIPGDGGGGGDDGGGYGVDVRALELYVLPGECAGVYWWHYLDDVIHGGDDGDDGGHEVVLVVMACPLANPTHRLIVLVSVVVVIGAVHLHFLPVAVP
ncbi:hypothetical protein QCA50_017859 [Cerrena zonata]|uniref:Uncharacterized protein n=1 Tax=Cerrena zonata TaxID=2478898 RepID=A0AAW0FJ94_9APHY